MYIRPYIWPLIEGWTWTKQLKYFPWKREQKITENYVVKETGALGDESYVSFKKPHAEKGI